MDGMRRSLGSAWSSLIEKVPALKELEGRVASMVPVWQEARRFQLGGRSYLAVRELGEGGYSTAFLVRQEGDTEAVQGQAHPEYALKQIFLGGEAEAARARREIDALRSVHHPNVIELLAADITTIETPQGPRRTALLLFPAFLHGSAWDLVLVAGRRREALHPRLVLSIFIELCSALEALHAAGLAHRDVKPHNMLLQRRRGAAARVVLMDFGSVAHSRVEVTTRDQARELEEEAEAHTTAPYRAPELWEVQPGSTITEAVDMWAAGCVLFCLAHGESPFERATATTGGSLRLAVLNGGYTLPDTPASAATLAPLIRACLSPDPATRPTATQAKLQAQALLEAKLTNDGGRSLVDSHRGGAHLTAAAPGVADLNDA